MRFITCGVTWGESDNYNFKKLSKEFNIAILGTGNKNIGTFQKVSIGEDYIALKKGFSTFALGKTKKSYSGTWKDIQDLAASSNYTIAESEEKLFNDCSGSNIEYIEVEEWIWFEDTPIYYALRQSTVQIKNQKVYGQCSEVIDKYIEEQTMQKYITLLEQQKNIVLTGAPGTGKTYLAKDIAEIMIGDYSEMLEKRISNMKKSDIDKNISLSKEKIIEFQKAFPKDSLKDMTLDKYCIGNGEKNSFCWWIERGLQSSGRFAPGFSTAYMIYKDPKTGEYKTDEKRSQGQTPEQLMPKIAESIRLLVDTKTIEELPIPNMNQNLMLRILYCYYPEEYFPVFAKEQLEKICRLLNLTVSKKSLFENNRSILKHFNIDEKFKDIDNTIIMSAIYNGTLDFDATQKEILDNTSFAQFHPSYDYTDFVEGLRPVQKEDGEIGFKLKNGIFKEFCEKATKFPKEKFVFIIDEINRAELSKVFGELFFSIEPGYRGKKGTVQLQYSNLYADDSNIYDPFKDGFYVPENVYIIATMNDIDRSIEPFDFAMKRRFAWYEITPKDTFDSMWVGQDGIPYLWATEAKNRMFNLNELISKEFSSAYEIGGAYFLKLNNLDGDFEKLWTYHLEPVIKDYLRGDKSKKLEDFKFEYNKNTTQNDEQKNGQS